MDQMHETVHSIGADGSLKNPLGSWSDLKPNFNRQVRALFKKQFLIKIRHAASIVEVVIALVMCFVMYPVHILAKTTYDEILSPQMEPYSEFPRTLLAFFMMFNESVITVMPNNDKMKNLINATPYLKLILSGQTFGNITLPKREIKYFDSIIAMEEEIYKSDANGLAINWENWQDIDAYTNPKFEIFLQSLVSSPELDVFMELKHACAITALTMEGKNLSESPVISSSNPLLMRPVGMNFYTQKLSRPKLTKQFSQVGLCLALIVCIPAILASMPDMETVLNEKDSHVSALAFLMGMSETAYWFVNFFTPFILCAICYLLSSFVFCFWFALVGSDFSFIFIVSLLFIIAQLWFQFFISTFIQKGSSGRAMTVVMIVFILFFSYLHTFLTLDLQNSSTVLRHVLCIIPFSAYELFLMQDYITCVEGIAPFQWNKMTDKSYVCPPWIPLMWLIIDIILYFTLFLLFNATNPRPFGTPLIKWSEFFKKEAWKRLFTEGNTLKTAPESEEFMSVKGLCKTFHGSKDVKALDNVEFTINAGEVIVMIGPNGAGKSTLINTIAGAVEPSEGVIQLLGGKETTRFKDVQSYLGVCFQDNVIINLLSVREHFELFGAIRGVPKDTLEDCVEYFAANMQLTHMLSNRAGDLSGGQKRKLCIGLSLLGNPPVVCMDEPTAGVDVQARQLIWKMISNLKDSTIIVTSHALEEAEAVSSRLFIVAGGKIPFCGTSTELRNKFKCGYLLRVEREDGTAGPVIELAQSFVPDAHLVEDREDTISMPVDAAIPAFLESLTENKKEYGVISYSFSVEQLEDMLLKLIQSEEVNNQTN